MSQDTLVPLDTLVPQVSQAQLVLLVPLVIQAIQAHSAPLVILVQQGQAAQSLDRAVQLVPQARVESQVPLA